MSNILDSKGREWFSAQIRFVCYVAGSPKFYRDTVIVFRALEWRDAQERAVSLGRSREEHYENGEALPVHWRLQNVVSLDWIANHDLDGSEVHSHLIPVGDVPVPNEDELNPEQSHPIQTI